MRFLWGKKYSHQLNISIKSDIPVFPITIASVDIGSNAIRFMAAEFLSPEKYKQIDYERFNVRLGHGVFLHGRLSDDQLNRALTVLSSISRRIKELNITHYRCVATSAVRESRNGLKFIERAKRESGIEVTIINGTEEANLIYTAVKRIIPITGGKWLIVDLGGGSVEVSLADDSGILWSESHSMGSIRLLEELSVSDEESGRFKNLLSEYISTLKIPKISDDRTLKGFIATGGNIEEISRIINPQNGRENVSIISVNDLRSTLESLTRLSFSQRMEKFGLREDRADVIIPAAMVYLRIAASAGVKNIYVPHVGIKEGIIYDLLESLTAHGEHERIRREQIMNATINIGRKFNFDEAHCIQVAKLALSIFDQLVDLHKMGEDERRILMAASVLHDIGSHISNKKHHKHSLYMIQQIELPGFSGDEILMTANVARYHRRSEPTEKHIDFAVLMEKQREMVRMLAAILRISDALDREHQQRVLSILVEKKNGLITFNVHSDGDIIVEKWALSKKTAMFQNVFEVSVEIKVA